jgi:hypothetical protein
MAGNMAEIGTDYFSDAINRKQMNWKEKFYQYKIKAREKLKTKLDCINNEAK